MDCTQCDRNVDSCICVDRVERLTDLLNCPFVVLGSDYRQRIQENIDRAKAERASGTQTITE